MKIKYLTPNTITVELSAGCLDGDNPGGLATGSEASGGQWYAPSRRGVGEGPAGL